jgi:hypothetical protein
MRALFGGFLVSHGPVHLAIRWSPRGPDAASDVATHQE